MNAHVLSVVMAGLMCAVGAAPLPAQSKVQGPAAPRAAQPRSSQPVEPSQPAVRRAAGEAPLRDPGTGAGKVTGSKAGNGVARPAGPAMPLQQNIAPKQPAWYPLEPAVQEWVDQVLLAWEKTSDQIVTFKCTFKRWEHDPVFGPKDPNLPFTYGEGLIQYAKPDKGLFKVEKLLKYSPPLKLGEEPQWLEQIGEHWVCDGRSIYEFDVRGKRLLQKILPKEMQGKAIADGPLPFLFGAKVATLKARYWIGPMQPPKESTGEYWLEAVPKFRQDAANFQKVSIILDEKDFLPKALDVFAPNYDAKLNRAHTEYAFENRETNGNSLIPGFFKRDFFEPKVPSGWKRVVEDMNVAPEGPRPVQGPSPGQAKRPSATKTK